MPYTLKPPLGSPVTIASEARRDVLLARGYTLVPDEPASEPAEKPAAKRVTRRAAKS